MQVNSLNINNLRNLSAFNIEPHSSLNCFTGDNGAGKTSILEALAVLSKGRSFRTGQIASLIGPQDNFFQVVTSIESDSGDYHSLGLERGTDYWKARRNGEDVSQLSELTLLLPFVLLEPGSHTLVSGPPDGRRKYIDWCVFHVKHDYLLLWRRFIRTLKQRNAALRQSSHSVVESLDQQFVTLGEQLNEAREEQTRRLSVVLHKTLPGFNRTLGDIGLKFKKGWSGNSLAEALKLSMQHDLERGATGPGPHKADLLLTMNGVPAKERLSRGEQKALTAALVMAQAQLMCESGERPLLLLDDLSSEFDQAHFAKVLRAGLELGGQIWITGTEVSPAIRACGSGFSVFHVKHGALTETAKASTKKP